jgi:hypothetical protein
MTHIIFALLQLVLIPDLAKIVYDFVPDIECEYADGSTRCFKNGDTVDFTDVVHITVFTEFIITKNTKFRLLVDITGPVKLVGDMTRKFSHCKSFNSNTDLWDTSRCTIMAGMFAWCESFNPLGGLDSFDTTQCTNMNAMFSNCISFNPPRGLDSFNTSNCTDMSFMFNDCTSFNQPLDNFDILLCTNMSYMFSDCVSFDQSLDNFDIPNYTNTSHMFSGCCSI